MKRYNNCNKASMPSREFVVETIEEVSKSNVNQSKAKQLWTFSKQRRFSQAKPNCPYVAYNHDLSTLTNKHVQFGTTQRKVFTEVSESPTSWIYNPVKRLGTIATSFGESRAKCSSNSYIPLEWAKNPGPGRYATQSYSEHVGYTMRPKTAQNRTYFIENKEQAQRPGPCEYNVGTSRPNGKTTSSKFRTAILGGVGMMTKNKRFHEQGRKTPSSWMYQPERLLSAKKSEGGKIGTRNRKSFIDQATRHSFTPGPGNYKLPTEFGHYRGTKHD